MPPNDNDNPISIPEPDSNPIPSSEGKLHGSNSILPPEGESHDSNMTSSEGELHSAEEAILNNATTVHIVHSASNQIAKESDLEPVGTTFSSRGRPKSQVIS